MNHEFLVHIPEINCFVEIFRNAISKDKCDEIYKVVKTDCIRRYPIKVFNNISEQPRCNCLYADDDISRMDYSNSAIPRQPWNDVISELKYLVSSDTFHPNSCLVNGYIEIKDNVGAHRDKDLFDGNNFVCTVSIGGTRLFRFVPYDGKISDKMKIPDGIVLPKKIETYLNEGDVVYMYGNTNYYFKHEIPTYRKTIDKYEFKPRYSCTFRVIEDGFNPIFDTVDEMKDHYHN